MSYSENIPPSHQAGEIQEEECPPIGRSTGQGPSPMEYTPPRHQAGISQPPAMVTGSKRAASPFFQTIKRVATAFTPSKSSEKKERHTSPIKSPLKQAAQAVGGAVGTMGAGLASAAGAVVGATVSTVLNVVETVVLGPIDSVKHKEGFQGLEQVARLTLDELWAILHRAIVRKAGAHHKMSEDSGFFRTKDDCWMSSDPANEIERARNLQKNAIYPLITINQKTYKLHQVAAMYDYKARHPNYTPHDIIKKIRDENLGASHKCRYLNGTKVTENHNCFNPAHVCLESQAANVSRLACRGAILPAPFMVTIPHKRLYKWEAVACKHEHDKCELVTLEMPQGPVAKPTQPTPEQLENLRISRLTMPQEARLP